MKKLLLTSILCASLSLSSLYAEVNMRTSAYPDDEANNHITHPQTKPKPPIARPVIQYGEHYHTYITAAPSELGCDYGKYETIIKEKDEKIELLLKENARLKEEAQRNLQKRLKEEYDAELRKFEEKRP